MSNKKQPNISEILAHLGEDRSKHFGAFVGPIYQSSNFRFESVDEMITAIESEKDAVLYSRGNNPTVAVLREKLAALEGCDDALVFSSGVAAISAAVLSIVKNGDHVICVSNPYGWTHWLLSDYLKKFSIEVSYVEGTDLEDFKKAKKANTSLVFLESPNSFLFKLQNLSEVGSWAKENGLSTICDNSYCSPLFQQPHKLGIDLVVHSASKYINGHSDVVAGVLCGSQDRISKIFAEEYMGLGGILGPFEAFLLTRGLRTLEIRMDRVSESAAIVIAGVEEHAKIEQVHYPFHHSFPQLELAKKQMTKGTGQFSLSIKGADEQGIKRFVEGLKIFQLGVSWGGFESLVIPAIVKGENNPYPNNLVRFYVGMEKPEDLIADILQALEKI